MTQSYLSTWCFCTVKYFSFFKRSNFAVSTSGCFKSSFAAKGFCSSQWSYNDFTDTPTGALSLASWEKCGWALWRAKLVSQPETLWASPEAKMRDLLALPKAEVDFSIQKALDADLASHAAYRCRREASLASIETELACRWPPSSRQRLSSEQWLEKT